VARGAGDAAGRRTGLVVFVVGVLLLLAVFYQAYLELVASGRVASPEVSQGAVLVLATKGLFLFLMGFVASAISNKGIGLYQSAVHAEE
jgi:xanthine/uracil/vitamin C permease (AzgA family)